MSDTTRKITLRDGRILGLREFGAPDGFPVINNHGGLVCGLDIAPAHQAALKLGFRILSPDRPGLCDSDLLPGRTLQDWASNVSDLADELHLSHFGVLGWSMGGQYAFACAYYLADRVTATCVIAGCLPLDDPKNYSGLNPMDRHLTDMALTHPQNASLAFKAMGEIAQHTPALWNTLSARGLSPKDAETLYQLPPPGLAYMAAPALSSADGMVEEYRAWVRPWGFTPEQIRGKVSLWQGGQDHLVPQTWSEEFARRVPNAGLNFLAEEGHLLAFNHYLEILNIFAT